MSDTPRTDACYTRAGMMLAAQVDALDAECRELELENARLRDALKEAINWDGHDDEGIPAVWLKQAEEALK